MSSARGSGGRKGGGAGGDGGEDGGRPPLKSYHRILSDEMSLADSEMERPAGAIAMSGLLAGLGIGISVFLIAVFGTIAPEGSSELLRRVLMGNAYAAGFLLVIFARADLFTEYTTIALLPVMVGRSTVRALGRLWGLVYGANIVGAIVVAYFLVALGSSHGGFEVAALAAAASDLTHTTAGASFLSALLAGWLMGLMSWLIVAARETVSQVIFVWVIGMAIGLGHLHHCITGTAEVVAGMAVSSAIGPGDAAGFLLTSTLGNAVGALIFATIIRYSVAHPREEDPGPR